MRQNQVTTQSLQQDETPGHKAVVKVGNNGPRKCAIDTGLGPSRGLSSLPPHPKCVATSLPPHPYPMDMWALQKPWVVFEV